MVKVMVVILVVQVFVGVAAEEEGVTLGTGAKGMRERETERWW